MLSQLQLRGLMSVLMVILATALLGTEANPSVGMYDVVGEPLEGQDVNPGEPLEVQHVITGEPLEIQHAIAGEPLGVQDAIAGEPFDVQDAIAGESLEVQDVLDWESLEVQDLTCADAIRMLPPTVESPVIMQVFNKAYLTIEENFLLVMRQNAPQRLRSMYLICLDDESADRIGAVFGLPCFRINGVTSMGLLLLVRVKTLVCLLQAGHDVVMTDNDALWLRDPIPDLLATEGDMLFQRGKFPKIYREPVFGLTMCAGFAFYRAGGEGMDEFIKLMQYEANEVVDDQIGLNKAAIMLGLTWDYNASRSDMRNYDSTGPGRGVLTALPGPLVVTLLPHNKYTRHCNYTPISSDTLIAHCFPRKRRVDRMKEANLWLVD